MIETARKRHNCDLVCLSGWNLYAVDHRLLVQDYHRHNRPWPATWVWGWDGLRSVRDHQGHRFKITRVSSKNPDDVPAPAGNETMSLSGIFPVLNNGESFANHHSANADVDATIQILTQLDVWRLRRLALKKYNGWHRLNTRDADHIKGLEESKLKVQPPLPAGWVEDPDDDPVPTERSVPQQAAGPTAHAAARKGRLAEYWDLHHPTETMGKIAEYTNYYAGCQAVKLVRGGSGQRFTFAKCNESDPEAMLRYRPKKPGETLASMRSDYRDNEAITAAHVNMVLAIVVRMGVLAHKSLYQAWSTADGGSLSDACIKNAMPRNKFEKIWSRLCFMDYKRAK